MRKPRNFSYDYARDMFFPDLSEARALSCYARLTPQPFAVYLHPVGISARILDERVRYISCRQDRVFPDALSRAFAAKLGVRVEEMDAGHDVMLSAPGPLAHLLAGA